MFTSGGQSHGGFSKAMEGAPPPHWLSHVRVENLDATIEKAKNAGGKLAAGPFEMGEVGRIGIISDPQGAYLSAYQPEGDGPVPEGVFVWDELGTNDVDGAQRFYEEVFGWTTSDMGEKYAEEWARYREQLASAVSDELWIELVTVFGAARRLRDDLLGRAPDFHLTEQNRQDLRRLDTSAAAAIARLAPNLQRRAAEREQLAGETDGP